MSLSRFKFTKPAVAALPAAEPGKRLEYQDTEQPGLRLRVSATGAKSYLVLARVKGGALERITIGRADKLTPENARTQAKQIVAKLALGESYAAADRALRGEMRFSDLFTAYIENHSMRVRSRVEYEGLHRRHIEPALGKLRLSAVTHEKIIALHRGITKPQDGAAGAPTTANRCVALIKAVFNWAKTHGFWTGANPAESIQKNKENSRRRYLQATELARFFEAVQETAEPAKSFFMLALLTGARRSNVLGMRWRDIDMDEALWHIPALSAKAGEEMDIPLTPEAMAVLKQRQLDVGASEWVFPADSKSGHYEEPKRAWATLQKRAALEDLRIHDLRRTMGSWLVRTGANTAINAKALGHKSLQAAAVYQRIADTDPVREAMEKATAAFMGGK
jgi:integrase